MGRDEDADEDFAGGGFGAEVGGEGGVVEFGELGFFFGGGGAAPGAVGEAVEVGAEAVVVFVLFLFVELGGCGVGPVVAHLLEFLFFGVGEDIGELGVVEVVDAEAGLAVALEVVGDFFEAAFEDVGKGGFHAVEVVHGAASGFGLAFPDGEDAGEDGGGVWRRAEGEGPLDGGVVGVGVGEVEFGGAVHAGDAFGEGEGDDGGGLAGESFFADGFAEGVFAEVGEGLVDFGDPGFEESGGDVWWGGFAGFDF